MIYGDTRGAGWYADLIENQQDVADFRHDLLLEDGPRAESLS